jgi:hypothetical protein
MLVLFVAFGQSAGAQAFGTQTVASGQTISWGGDWTLDDELTTAGDGFDLVALTRGSAIVSVGGTGFPVAGTELRDVALQAFAEDATLQQVDRGEYNNVSYSLDVSGDDSEAPLGIFTLIFEQPDTTSIAVLLASPAEFQGAMEAAQDSISVDGTGLFNGVDAPVMQQQIDDALGQSGQADNPTPTIAAPEPAPTDAAPAQQPQELLTQLPAQSTESADSGDGGLLGGLNSGLGSATETPASSTTTQTSPVTSFPNSTTIASSGVDVAWSDEWTVDSEESDGIQLQSTGEIPLFFGAIDIGSVPSSLDAATLADSLIAGPSLEGVTLVDAIDVDPTRKVIILIQDDPLGSIYLIYDITTGTDPATAVLITVFEEDINAGVDFVASTLSVDGEPVFDDLQEVAPELFDGAAF